MPDKDQTNYQAVRYVIHASHAWEKVKFYENANTSTCFLLNSLWVCELFEAVLIYFHSLGSSAHLLLTRIKY